MGEGGGGGGGGRGKGTSLHQETREEEEGVAGYVRHLHMLFTHHRRQPD